jgi:tetratricopeptide (TPR) repeat protein
VLNTAGSNAGAKLKTSKNIMVLTDSNSKIKN